MTIEELYQFLTENLGESDLHAKIFIDRVISDMSIFDLADKYGLTWVRITQIESKIYRELHSYTSNSSKLKQS